MQWYFKVIKNYVNFSGRAHRTEYWMFTLVDIIIAVILSLFVNLLAFGNEDSPLFYLELIYTWGLLLPRLAVAVRRLHDTERSGLWLLPQYLAIPVAIFMGFMMAFSPNLDNFASFIAIFSGFIFLVALYSILILIFLVLRGTDGPNRFGDDPWENDYDDGYDDEYDNEEYDDDDEPRDDRRAHTAPPRRYAREQPQTRQYESAQDAPTSQNDIYDLNASFKEPPQQREESPKKSTQRPMPRSALDSYKNPFAAPPSEQEKAQFDRFGLVDDFELDDQHPRRSPTRKPSSDKNNA